MKINNLLLIIVLFSTTITCFSQEKTISVSYLFPGHDSSEVVTAEIKDGFVIIEGDIIIGEEKYLHQKAATLSSTNRLWPNGTIPYIIQADHPGTEGILDAIQHVNESTNLCLIERTTEEIDYVEFINGSFCASAIGKTGGRQTIVVSKYCGFGSFVHEILHSAGVYHEQSRHDRDEYVTIHYDNINENFESQFDKYYTGQDIGDYDYGSIMHYHEFSFSHNGNPTITVNPTAPEGTTIGQRDSLSTGDILGINILYPQVSNCGIMNLSCSNSGNITETDGLLNWEGINIVNLGTLSTPPVTVGVYFSRNSNISSSDFYLKNIQIPSILEGESYQFNTQIDKSTYEDLTRGQAYYLGFIIDPDGEVIESNEYDNNDCFIFSEDIALPITLASFNVNKTTDNQITLHWQTTSEQNNHHFNIQRTTNGQQWKTVGQVTSKGNNASINDYQYIDKQPVKGINYYRLEQVDKDGQTTLSVVRSVELIQSSNVITLFPNPMTEELSIDLTAYDQITEIKVFDGQGKLQLQQQLVGQQLHQLDVSRLAIGVYWIEVKNDVMLYTEKIIKQ